MQHRLGRVPDPLSLHSPIKISVSTVDAGSIVDPELFIPDPDPTSEKFLILTLFS